MYVIYVLNLGYVFFYAVGSKEMNHFACKLVFENQYCFWEYIQHHSKNNNAILNGISIFLHSS